MKGKFPVFYLGRTENASKVKGSYHYFFMSGEKTPKGFVDPTCVDFWSDKVLDVEFLRGYEAILDVQGEFVKFIEFVTK